MSVVQTGQNKALRMLRAPSFWLIIVAVSYFGLQIILLDEGRFFEWDEAVYVGEASSRFASPGWGPHRSGGLLWIVKPILFVSESVVYLRWYLAVVSAIVVGLAFSRWLRPGGLLAPVGMAVFSVGWLPIYYGSEVSPNLYVAAAAVGAAGSLVAFVAEGRRIDIAALGFFIAAAAFLRPSDGLVLSAGIALGTIVLIRSKLAIRVLAVTAVGLVVAYLPWVLEAYGRFGGPLERLRLASDVVGGGLSWNLVNHLRLFDGPVIGPDRVAAVSTAVIGVLLVYAALAVFGVLNIRRRPGPWLALGLSFLMALPYIVYVEALAPRFLLPALALISLPVGAGVLGLWRLRTEWGVVAALLLGVTVLWSVSVVDRLGSDEKNVLRDEARQVAVAIADAGGGDNCEFLTQYAYPQVRVITDCRGSSATPAALVCRLTTIRERNPEADVFVALWSEPPSSLTPYLEPIASGDPTSDSTWTLYTVNANEVACG